MRLRKFSFQLHFSERHEFAIARRTLRSIPRGKVLQKKRMKMGSGSSSKSAVNFGVLTAETSVSPAVPQRRIFTDPFFQPFAVGAIYNGLPRVMLTQVSIGCTYYGILWGRLGFHGVQDFTAPSLLDPAEKYGSVWAVLQQEIGQRVYFCGASQKGPVHCTINATVLIGQQTEQLFLSVAVWRLAIQLG